MPIQWLLLVTSLPGASGTPRMRVWRALKARGAGIVRDGVHLLPAGEDTRQLFEEQAGHVTEAGGSAHVIEFASRDAHQTDTLKALFQRDGDYRQWRAKAAELLAGLGALDAGECRRRQARLRRALEAITAVDYFPGPAQTQSFDALETLEAAVNAQHSPGEPTAAESAIVAHSVSDFQGRRWATRKGIWVDRIACAWLIRRFIDPEAAFLWLEDVATRPHDALGFDFDGAEFSHTEQGVSFQTLVRSFGLGADPALVRLGALVRYLDVGGTPIAEAAGFVAMLAGAKQIHPEDDALLQAAGALLDHLYTAYEREQIQ